MYTALKTVLAASIAVLPVQVIAGEVPDFAKGISAGVIAAISDGDFVAASYGGGQLAPLDRGLRDVLTVLSISEGEVTRTELPVSNSVTAAPEVLELSRDGRTAFVVERLGQRPDGGEAVSDLPPGRNLFAVDLADKAAPRLSDTVEISEFPEALALSPDGARIALASNTPDASIIQIVSFANGEFGLPVTFDLAEFGIDGDAEAPRGGVTATNVQWHPSGQFIAVNINTQNRVAFFAVDDRNGETTLRPWGNTVDVGPDPFVGRFTPDGRFYLTSDWGRDFKASGLEGRLPQQPSSISVIRLEDPKNSGDAHERIGSAKTDLSAEGMAISPDGTLVATVNMRGTAFPAASPRFHREATVTLLSFDPASGSLSKVADYPFEGILPEGGVFDLSGDHFLATVFEGHDGSKATGSGIEVFRVVKGSTPSLERLGRLPMPHGVHHVDVAE